MSYELVLEQRIKDLEAEINRLTSTLMQITGHLNEARFHLDKMRSENVTPESPVVEEGVVS